MRGANTSTFFGQVWLILNPLLLAGVYYLLVTIIRGRHDPTFFAHLCLGLFAFTPGLDRDHHRGAIGGLLGQAADQHAVPAAADPAVGGAYGVLPVPAHDPGLLRLPHHLPDRRAGTRGCCCRCTSWARMVRVQHGRWPRSSPPCRSTSATPRASCRTSSGSGCTCPRCCGCRSTSPDRFPRSLLTIIEINPMYSMLGGYAELMQGDRLPAAVHVADRRGLGRRGRRDSASCSSCRGSVSSLSVSSERRQSAGGARSTICRSPTARPSSASRR